MEETATKDAAEMAQLLEDAADYLLVHGRCMGEAVDGMKRCTIGAVLTVVPLTRWHVGNQAIDAIADYIGHPDVAQWSDDAADDFEVIDTLRLVAKDLRNEAAS